ncbi:DUF1080 domain-containing protein [Porifericola rhodea]|uniref:family 16 glycoside hydrolase n=1 Tax=Porifericola rhodea TaxID=930972 RepID=UPI002666E57F|nr:family 16 glycoside hydrolase [Porifericola rhodea]WKN30948.1 DUF1080 domain-containing protein [Porifericola rhodea]
MNQQPIPSRLLCLLAALLLYACSGQLSPSESTERSVPFQIIPLSNLSSFKASEAKNWSVASNVYADLVQKHHLETTEGTGVLVNQPDDTNKSELATEFEHGDIELELDFLLPKGSNSGLYLQGRYELQLIDSWGKQQVSSGDCGGIYQRWNAKTNSGFEGIAPLVNACKAPGLWQNLKIRFQSPKFDKNGKKTANARFLEVILNDAIIHQNVEVSGPTAGAFFENESSLGPLVIQGDHGPIAFRNIQYKPYAQERIALADLSYQFYEGKFENFDTLASLTPTKAENTDSLTFIAAGDYNDFAIHFDGKMIIPKSGTYFFDARAYGPVRLSIDGRVISTNDNSQHMSDSGIGQIELKEGEYPFSLTFLKNERPWRKGMSLYYEGPQIPKTALHAASSVPLPPAPEPILVSAESEVQLQRGFWIHQNKKRTHTVAVGMPENINYVLELSNGALLSGWRGQFLDATDMWHQRGESQLMRPMGSPVEFVAKPSIASLSSSSAHWPDTLEKENSPFLYKGYTLLTDGTPQYHYLYENSKVEDQIVSNASGRGLNRSLKFTLSSSQKPFYCLLAEGSKIEKLKDGSFAINDKDYYLKLEASAENDAILRNEDNQQQLLLPVNSSKTIEYSLIW